MADVDGFESCSKNINENNEVNSTRNGAESSLKKTVQPSLMCKNGEDSYSSEVESFTSETDKQHTDDSARKAGLFLRPSALSRDSKLSSILKPSTLTAVSSSYNKFANCNETAESIFNIGGKSEKVDGAPTPTTPVVVPVPVPLSNPNYVFGQNIKDRVVESANGNGTMLFSSAVNSADSFKVDKTEERESSSLLEDAARCEQQRNTKRKYEEVQTTTGEEDETNILQLVVKLFAFEGGSWVERGRGSLRLNDSGGRASRIVIRTLGSLRVILNTKIWGGMQVTRASDKSIRTTALDAAGLLKVFLIQATPSDINMLFDAMESRVKRCRVKEECTSTSKNAENTDGEDPPAKVPALESVDA